MNGGLRVALARALERGAGPRLPAAEGALAAAFARGLARPLRVPSGVRVVCVGGATLGGSGKTPVALAVARALAARGLDVALVGHAYGASPGRARQVRPDDRVDDVGDEALVAARALARSGVAVLVAPRRQHAVDLAARAGRVLVLDGPLQLAPRRADVAILALDAEAPWGAGALPPRGDLRARRADLLAACDLAALVGDGAAGGDRDAPDAAATLRVVLGATQVRAGDGAPRALASLAGARVGLALGLARPARVVRRVAAAGVTVATRLELADHATPGARWLDRAAALGRRAGVDAWLATDKCATRLPPALGGVPVLSMTADPSLADAGAALLWARLHAGTP